MASEGHPEAPKFPVPSLTYEAGAPMLTPPTSYANEYRLPQAEHLPQSNQLDRPKRTKNTRRIIAVVVFIALLSCVCAVILVLRYLPEQRVVIWVCECKFMNAQETH
jgi:hypothetical protein